MSEVKQIKQDEINQNFYDWLFTTPTSDVNFKNSLERANIPTIQAVLKDIKPEDNVTRRKVLEARLRKLNKENPVEQDENEDSSAINHRIVVSIPVSKIFVCPFEPQARRRAKFKDEETKSLAQSILNSGLEQPILVRPFKVSGKPVGTFEIVFGERRWLAHQVAKIKFIDCFVKDLTDAEVIERQYQENHERQNNDPLDDAFYFKYLQEKENYSVRDLSIKFSISEKSVLNKLKLNDLITEAKEELSSGILPLGHAVYMARLPEKAQREIVAEGYAYKYNDRADGHVSFAEFKEEVEENVMRRLIDAPFNPEDPRLHLKNLKCSACRERSGFAPKLFDELAENDTCLNKSCFESKTNVHLKLERESIADTVLITSDKPVNEIIKEVPLVTDRSWVNQEGIPFKEKVLTKQEFLPKKECEFSELSLIVDGDRKGQQTYICRNGDCTTHHPKPEAPARSDEELKNLETKFNEKVACAVRLQVLKSAKNYFDDYKPFWQFDDSIKQLVVNIWCRFNSEEKSEISEVVKDWGLIPTKHHTREEVQIMVDTFDKRQQSEFLALLNFYMEISYSDLSQDYIKKLAKDYTNLDYKLLDAETRVNFAPDEFKQKAKAYSDAVWDKRNASIPFFWFDLSAEEKTEV